MRLCQKGGLFSKNTSIQPLPHYFSQEFDDMMAPGEHFTSLAPLMSTIAVCPGSHLSSISMADFWVEVYPLVLSLIGNIAKGRSMWVVTSIFRDSVYKFAF